MAPTASASIWASRTAGGNIRRKPVHGSLTQAKKRLTELLRAKDTGSYVEPSKQTVGDYLAHWLKIAVKPRVKRRTYEDYESRVRRYIRPALGPVPLARLSPVAIQQLYSDMLAGTYRTPRRKGGDRFAPKVARPKPLSARSVRYVHAILHNALHQAVKWRMLAQNPAQAVDLPNDQKREKHFLTPEESRRFLTAAETDSHAALWMLLHETGMRLGEALALQWKDLNGDEIRIERTIVYPGGWRFETPKTKKSRRTVDLPANVVAALGAHRAKQGRHAMRLGAEYDRDLDLIFAGTFGKPLHPQGLRKDHFFPIRERAELPPIRIHDLRHTHASQLLAIGVPVKDVSARLGHATASMTLDTYGHVMPSAGKKIAAQLDQLRAANA